VYRFGEMVNIHVGEAEQIITTESPHRCHDFNATSVDYYRISKPISDKLPLHFLTRKLEPARVSVDQFLRAARFRVFLPFFLFLLHKRSLFFSLFFFL
jgi:hypothetical protein